MARGKNGDLVVQILDTVAQLEATTKLHAEQMEAIAKLAMETSARLTGLGSYTTGLGKEVLDLAKEVRDHANRMEHFATGLELLGARVTSLEEDAAQQAQNYLAASITSRTTVQQVGQLARLLNRLTDSSEARFVKIEGRLTALEKKTG